MLIADILLTTATFEEDRHPVNIDIVVAVFVFFCFEDKRTTNDRILGNCYFILQSKVGRGLTTKVMW